MTVRIKKTEKVYESKFVNLFNSTYIDNNNKEKNWLYVSRRKKPHTYKFSDFDVVRIAPVLDGQLVLIKEFRIPLNTWVLSFPAGCVDENDTLKDVVEREVMEEVGLTVDKYNILTHPLALSAGITTETCLFVWAECSGTLSNKFNEPSEFIVMFDKFPVPAVNII